MDCQREADVLVIDCEGRYAYAFEVKSRNSGKHRKKAISQLSFDEEYISEEFGIERVFKFYVHGKGRDDYVVRRIFD